MRNQPNWRVADKSHSCGQVIGQLVVLMILGSMGIFITVALWRGILWMLGI